MERITLPKSIILPQFLFLFQTLLVLIPLPTLHKWQKMLVDFVWDRGFHRVSLPVLSRPAKSGGFGLPLLLSYYVAAELRAIFSYLQRLTTRRWVCIEESHVTPYHLREILWNKQSDRPKFSASNPFLEMTLAVWDKYRPYIISNISPQSAFLGQKWFPPALDPKSFKNWRMNDIYRLSDISSKGMMLSKTKLEQRFHTDLPRWQYHQEIQMFKNVYMKASTQIETTMIETRMASGGDQVKGLVSLLYKT